MVLSFLIAICFLCLFLFPFSSRILFKHFSEHSSLNDFSFLFRNENTTETNIDTFIQESQKNIQVDIDDIPDTDDMGHEIVDSPYQPSETEIIKTPNDDEDVITGDEALHYILLSQIEEDEGSFSYIDYYD